MKIFILLTSLLFSNVYAIESDCEETPDIAKFAVPNCLKEDFLPENESGKDFCRDCGLQFSKNYTGQIPNDTKSIQEHFLKTTALEFKKTLSNNLVETIKLAALPSTGSKYEKSKSACSLSRIDINEKNCKSPSAVKILRESKILTSLENQMAGELAKILSTESNFKPTDSLLMREEPVCFIPEKQLLYLMSSTIDGAFDSKLLAAFRTIDPTKIKSIKELFRNPEIKSNYSGDISELRDSINSHPFLKEIFKSPESVASFFKGIKEPINNESFKSHLYSKNSANLLDEKLASDCENSFKHFKDAICNSSFESGNLNLDPISNLSKLTNDSFIPQSGKLASTDDLLNDNIKFVKYCSREPISQKTLNLTSISKIISQGIDEEQQNLPYDGFRQSKYKNEIGNLNTNICQMKAENCIEGTFSCRLYQQYQKVLDKESIDFKLANSSNDEVKDLLRSMIGDTSKADPKTKEILVAHGIIPKDDGSFVKQPEIPERQPDYFAKAAANPQPAKLAQAAPVHSAAPQKPSRSPASTTSFSDEGYSNNQGNEKSSSPEYSMPDFSDITKNNDELRDIQNEIRRRLSDLSPTTSPNKAQAKKVIKDSFAARGRSLSPEQEENYAAQMMEPAAPVATLPQLQREIASANGPNRPAVSGGDTQLDKWKKSQKEAALMGMAGAQAVSKDEIIAKANASQGKELTKVALNLAEDPRVTLSDVFNNKLSQNDSETQLLKVLLRNKNNFVLQVKSVNFKVIFDEKQNFNILLDSGDRNEAERIRPQLEMFLKKLRA